MDDHERRGAPAVPNDSEDEPVLRWQKGIDPEEAFEQIFQRHYQRVFLFFLTHGFSEEESRDLSQETFLHVFRRLSDFRGDASFRAWLLVIASNVYRNALRSRATQKRWAAEVPLDGWVEERNALHPEPDDPLANVMAQERSQLLKDALEQLPPQMRRCIFFRVDQDLKYREIAILMNLAIDTVKAHLHQARQLLRQKLEEFLHEGEP